MNETIKFLYRCLYQLEKDLLARDPEFKTRERDYDRLYQAFLTRHLGNQPLTHEIIGLLDAQASLEDHRAGFFYFLGLQTGMELGGLNLLGRMD